MVTPLEAGLDSLDGYLSDKEAPNKSVIKARVRAMGRAYDKVWAEDNQKYSVVAIEKLLIGPLKNLENMKDSGYLMAGKLDLILKEKYGRKRTICMDHKTLSSGFDDDDIEHLLISGQQCQYAALGWTNGIKFDAAIWDVCCKSLHVPRKESIAKGSPSRIAGRKTTVNGVEYVKGQVVPATPDTVTPGETMEEFEERVYGIYTDSPSRFFARPEVPVIKDNIISHMHELYLNVKELDLDAKSDIHLKNPDSCYMYGRYCEYLGLCSGRSHEQDGTWTTKDQLHPELEVPNGVDPRSLISNSRMACYRACRLKHFRKFNQGLVKIKEPHNDALFTGSAFHHFMEIYYKIIMETQN